MSLSPHYYPQIRALAGKRFTLGEIADRLEITYGQVWNTCRQLGIDVAKKRDDWLPSEDRCLTALWNDGCTASHIARQFVNRTRNAVIGRAHRLNLPSRKSPIKR